LGYRALRKGLKKKKKLTNLKFLKLVCAYSTRFEAKSEHDAKIAKIPLAISTITYRFKTLCFPGLNISPQFKAYFRFVATSTF
jgi:hypothetical protein